MSFIRKIKKGKHTYLAEVEGKRVDGKVVQRHIRYVGREINGEIIKSGSIEDTEVSKVVTWGPLMALNTLAKQISLSTYLGDEGDYLLSLAFAHCLEPRSLNQMKDWYTRTDLHNILDLSELSEKKIYNSLDFITDQNSFMMQKNIFNSVKNVYDIKSKGYLFDVTNVYFYGSNCPMAKRGKSKEGQNKPLIQIGLAVTENEGIPIFHKTFEGNIIDSRILQDMVHSFHELDIKNLFIVWDRGISSDENIVDAKKAGFEVLCGLPIRLDLKTYVKKLIAKENILDLKNRIKLKNSIFYCIKKKYKYKTTPGHLIVCYNEEIARNNKEKLLDRIDDAKTKLTQNKPIHDSLKKYFQNQEINYEKITEDLELEGYSMLFCTKDMDTEKIVKQYFEKDKVEKAFRSLKSTLGIRPIRHWLESRVKSHIFICYLSYLLLTLLETKLKNKNISSTNALEKLNTAYKIHLKNNKLKQEFTKIVTLSNEQKEILKAIDKNILKRCV